MIDDTIQKIRTRIEVNKNMAAGKKAELLELLAELKDELQELYKSDADNAASIGGFAQVYTHEATREQKNEALVTGALAGLKKTVEGLETSHPKLTGVVNDIATVLANMGV